MNTTSRDSDLTGFRALLPAMLTGGVGAAAALLIVAYVLHFPGLALPGAAVGIAMLIALFAALYLAARAAGRAAAILVGAGAGFIAGLMSLVAMGSVLQGAIEEHGPVQGGFMFTAWALFTGIVGGVAGIIARRRATETPTPARQWLPILALITAASTLALITMGGIVTAARAGLAVPDWPGTFGANMFLYPLSQMTGGVYYEHAHRLMGAFVGLSTIALMILCLWLARPVVKALSVVALVHVIVQGVMGGLRVTELSTGLAIVHGVSAQLFLALLLIIALTTSTAWRTVTPESFKDAGKQRAFSIAALAFLFLQIALGAVTRHVPGSNHPLWTHAGFSILAAAAIILAGAHASKVAREPLLKKLGVSHLHAVGLQMLLGVGALWVVIAHGDAEEAPALDLLITTSHQVVGALLLSIVALTLIWSYRAIRPLPHAEATLA